jgi:hypothetical protein
MLFTKKKEQSHSYDKEKQIPVLRCSICTGEQVAGFKDKETGKFTEIMMIRNEDDLTSFIKQYGVKEIKKEY